MEEKFEGSGVTLQRSDSRIEPLLVKVGDIDGIGKTKGAEPVEQVHSAETRRCERNVYPAVPVFQELEQIGVDLAPVP